MKLVFFIALFLTLIFFSLLLFIVASSRSHKMRNEDQNLVGLTAIAETDLDLLGIVLINGEAWKASSRIKILKGTKVKVVGTEGVLLEVEPILP